MRLIPFFPDLQDFPFADLPELFADDRRPTTDDASGFTISASADHPSEFSISAAADDRRPKADDVTNYYSNQNKKRRGQTVEYRLALECMERNIPIARPYLDCEKYDAVILPHPTQPAKRVAELSPGHEPWVGNFFDLTEGRREAPAPQVAHEKRNGKRSMARELETRNPKLETPWPTTDDRRPTTFPMPVWYKRIKVLRIQVRSAHTIHGDAYDIPLTSGASGLPYHLGDFELLAAYIAPERTWYFIPAEVLLKRGSGRPRPENGRRPRTQDRRPPTNDQRPMTSDQLQTSVSLYPHVKGSKGRFEKFRERWDLLT